ncbi:hypothetical protein [Cyclobacterium marinum]|uniref:hypothetical protein n=1 Tax=Cyclobacterium marinum TaxID=104 RepID=UPI0002D28806|nr:hypothetical protein [Cyclobacterium marinum]
MVFEDFLKDFFGDGYPDDIEILYLGSFANEVFLIRGMTFIVPNLIMPKRMELPGIPKPRAGRENCGRLPLENPIFLIGRSAPLAGGPLLPSLHLS